MIHKIVHVTSSLEMGGAENTLLHLVRGLQHAGIAQEVICFNAGPLVEYIRELGVPVYVVRGLFWRYDIIFIWRLWRTIKKARPNVIHAQLWFANFLMRCYARISHVPVVCAIHSPLNHNKKNTWFRMHLDRVSAGWAVRTVFVARHLRSSSALAPFVPARRAVTIQNGVDIAYLYARSLVSRVPRECYEFCAGNFIIGTVGRLVPVKNQRVLVDLLVQLPPSVRLLIIGEGAEKEALLAYAHACGVAHAVKILSGVAIEYYDLFDIFMLPSHAEGLSLALLEAMSFMLPVVVARGAGADQVIKHEQNGFVVDYNDVGFVAQLISALMQDSSKRNEIGQNAYQVVQNNFSWACMVRAYRELFEEVVVECRQNDQ